MFLEMYLLFKEIDKYIYPQVPLKFKEFLILKHLQKNKIIKDSCLNHLKEFGIIKDNKLTEKGENLFYEYKELLLTILPKFDIIEMKTLDFSLEEIKKKLKSNYKKHKIKYKTKYLWKEILPNEEKFADQ